MNKLYVLIIIVISFISCDGKYRVHMSNEAVLREANLLESFSEELKYIPEKPVEIETDTLMSNGFNIKINYYSVENSTVSKAEKNENGITTKTYHQNFEAEFTIQKNDIAIQKGIINKAFFYESKNKDNAFWNDAIMQYVWVDYNAVTEYSIQLNTSFHVPDTNNFKDFTITIFDTGAMEIKEISAIKNKA